MGSFPARGTWIEMHARRELRPADQSFPARGTWIEINFYQHLNHPRTALFPARGTWIEMAKMDFVGAKTVRRSPQGERGLKFRSLDLPADQLESFPARGTWIEIGEQ